MMYDMSDNLEDLDKEELTHRLATIEKESEHLRKENDLFESYILRVTDREKSFADDIHSDSYGGKKARGTRHQRDLVLSAEEKQHIATTELDTLKINIDKGKDKSEELLEHLKTILEGTDLAIATIKREAYDFKRDIVMGAENERTGKVIAEKLEKYMEMKMKQKDETLDKLTTKNTLLKKQFIKADAQIKNKEDMGDDLKFIDFHQLQIENKKHVKDIDERNQKLYTLKMTATKTLKNQTTINKALDAEKETQAELNYEIMKFGQDIKSKLDDIKKLNKDRQHVKNEFKILDAKARKTQESKGEKDYIELKNDLQKKEQEMKNLERTVDIHEALAKQARIIIKKAEGMRQMNPMPQ